MTILIILWIVGAIYTFVQAPSYLKDDIFGVIAGIVCCALAWPLFLIAHYRP